MIIDKQTIAKVANLARIEIQENEVEALITDMNKILTFMEKLNELDTNGVDPLVYMNKDENVWREDVVDQKLNAKDGLKNSAVHDDRFFFVPKILEK